MDNHNNRSCPIPELQAALAPYLHSRQHTSSIRRTLARYLVAHLPSTTPQARPGHAHHLQLHHPPDLNSLPPPSSVQLKTSRRHYSLAVHSKLTAHQQHEGLRRWLHDQRDRYFTESSSHAGTLLCDRDLVGGYILLLRQRARFGALCVIRDSLEKVLESTSTCDANDPKELVLDAIGEQCSLPSERLDPRSPSSEVHESVFRLKKELLHVKSRAETWRRHRATVSPCTSGRENTSIQDQVHALARCRQQLIEWVEHALARISEDESELPENASPIKSTLPQNPSWDPTSLETSVNGLYNEYTSARTSIIHTFTSSEAVSPCLVTNGRIECTRLQAPAERPGSVIAIPHVHSYLRELLYISEQERSLLDYTVYLGMRLVLAGSLVDGALKRLASESHLLTLGSYALTDWSRTSNYNDVGVERFIAEQLQELQSSDSGFKAISKFISLYHYLINRLNLDI